MAKYMLIMRPQDGAEFDADFDFNEILETVGRFNDELIRAGVLLAAEGLADPDEGVVVDFTGETPVVTDGPYGETKELFAGYYILDVPDADTAVQWAGKLPGVRRGVDRIEVRPIMVLPDMPSA